MAKTTDAPTDEVGLVVGSASGSRQSIEPETGGGGVTRDSGLATRNSFLISLLDEAFSRKAWHGPTLWGALRGVTPDQAAWRPAPDRHNIWEIAVHAAYWKYIVRRRITGDRRQRFPLQGKDWFVRPAAAGESDWRADLRLLRDEHTKLRSVVANLSPAELAGDRAGERAGERRAHQIRGIAAHDVYHAGQIQLLKRLNRAA